MSKYNMKLYPENLQSKDDNSQILYQDQDLTVIIPAVRQFLEVWYY